MQSEDEISLDPTERWNSPVEQRSGDDSGCFLVTDKDGLSQAINKQGIPVDKTGSSGFWSQSSAPRNDMQNYHDSLMQDLIEAESDETIPYSSSTGKATILNCSLSSVAATSRGQHQRGGPEILKPTPVSCVAIEPECETTVRVTLDNDCAPSVDTTVVTTNTITGRGVGEEDADSGSLGSSVETLSQSSESHEYINCQRYHLGQHSSSSIQNLSTLFYTDGKGYVRFVSRNTETSLPISAQ